MSEATEAVGGTRDLPSGAVVFATQVAVAASGRSLCALATDPPRYATVEPRLREARWLDADAPAVGSRVAVVGDIPFSIPIVRLAVGHPRGVAVLEELDLPRLLSYSLETDRASGRMTARFHDRPGGCLVEVRGWIVPHSRLGQVLLASLGGALRPLAEAAIRRGVSRAAAAARDTQCDQSWSGG